MKLIYSKQLQHLIVSYDVTEVENPESPFTSSTTSYLEFVHPDTHQTVIRPDSTDNARPWRPQSDRGETVSCISDWSFKRDGDLYQLIAVGTTFPTVDHKLDLGGRLVLLKVWQDKSDPSRIECKVVHKQMLADPVRAIAAYGDSLLVSSGRWLLPFSSKDATMRWALRAPYQFPSPVIAITVHQNLVIVTTSRHSWAVLEIVHQDKPYEQGGSGAFLALRGSAQLHRDGLAHMVSVLPYHQPNPIAFVSERGGAVGVAQFDQLTEEFSIFPETHVQDSILRFVSDPTRKTGIYGFALNGAIYRFYLPAENESPLLQFLQNLCYKNEALYPSRPRRLRRINPMTFEDGCHIDGDILSHLARRGPDFLRHLMGTLNVSKSYDLLETRYRQLALRAIGSYAAEDVIGWLRSLVDTVI